jgi:hypothetical protein
LKWVLAGTWIASLTAAAVAGHHLAAPDRDPTALACDVECSLSESLRERDVLLRTYELAASLQQIDEDNIDTALAVFESQRIGVSAFEVRMFMFAWSRIDPAGAFAWANAWSGPWRGTLENAAIYAWAFREPKGAVRTLEAMEGPRREELRSSLVTGWAQSGDTAGLSDYLLSRPASPERSRLIGMLLAELIVRENGRDAVRSWAEGISKDAPNQAKATAFLTAGGALAQNDPMYAATFFEAHQSFEYAQPALRTIARRWVDFHDPRDLFAWLAKLDPGESRDDAVDAGFSRWWSKSPQEAAVWVRASSGDAAFDPAVAVFARELSRESAAHAIKWADDIQDPVLRRRTIAPILKQWAAADRRAARAWMNEHAMSAKLQREVLGP